MSAVWVGGVQSHGPNQVIGKCTCGWRGKPRQLTRTALRDVLTHMTEDDHQERIGAGVD